MIAQGGPADWALPYWNYDGEGSDSLALACCGSWITAACRARYGGVGTPRGLHCARWERVPASAF